MPAYQFQLRSASHWKIRLPDTKHKSDMIPKDPVMLLSYINTQLRDFYDSYEDLCKSLDFDQNEVKQKLSMIGYEYDESLNQFK